MVAFDVSDDTFVGDFIEGESTTEVLVVLAGFWIYRVDDAVDAWVLNVLSGRKAGKIPNILELSDIIIQSIEPCLDAAQIGSRDVCSVSKPAL
ncbi:hypothetical protein PNP85_13235 [Halobacterium salinarum]|uniref:hypothetical protein n=1 Tax=Halobacterium salinarum TaxID=2242 RepID=UPI0025567E2B|nr:hypothetical protein [Halobacterium salinarum]MDL0140468.1 hypothetical protein [Halobacterium salinarum]